MMNIEKKRTKKEIILITIGGVVVLLAAMLLCFMSIKHKDAYVMHYSDTSELDYNVYLKKNNYYITPSLPKNRLYLSTLIDYIDASFNYKFNVDEDLDLGYKYYINAKVVVDDGTGKKIFDKEEILVDKTDIQQVKDKNFSITEELKIDYNKYNKLASSFLEEYDISARANVIVGLYVEVEGTTEKFENKLNDSAVVSFEIPLTTKTAEIKMNYDLTNNKNEVFEYGKTSIVHPILFVISILLALVTIAWVAFEIFRYVINKDSKVKYQERLKKIFCDYGSYISKKAMTSNTKEIMYTMSLRVEIVNTFDDLINVRDSIEKPILFYESIPGEQAVFYIIDTKVSYIYIMNAKDFDKKNKETSTSKISKVDEMDNIKNIDNKFDEIECEEMIEQEENDVVEEEIESDEISKIEEKSLEEEKEDVEEAKSEIEETEITTNKAEETTEKSKTNKKRNRRYNRQRRNNSSQK